MVHCLPSITYALCPHVNNCLVPLSLCNFHVLHFYNIFWNFLTFLGYGSLDSGLSVYPLPQLPCSHDAMLCPLAIFFACSWPLGLCYDYVSAYCLLPRNSCTMFSSHGLSGPYTLAADWVLFLRKCIFSILLSIPFSISTIL